MRDEGYDYMISKWGEPTDSRPVPPEVLEKYRPIMPPVLISYWESEGFCQFKHGLYFSVNPDDWQPVVDAWLEDTPFASMGPFYAITRNAFGRVELFNESIGAAASITPLKGWVSSRSLEPEDERGLDSSVRLHFGMSSPESHLFKDIDRKPLFDRALKKLGPVGWNEMYAFEPALFLGGAPKLEHLVKLDWRVHLILLRQLVGTPEVPWMDVKQVMADIQARHRKG